MVRCTPKRMEEQAIKNNYFKRVIAEHKMTFDKDGGMHSRINAILKLTDDEVRYMFDNKIEFTIDRKYKLFAFAGKFYRTQYDGEDRDYRFGIKPRPKSMQDLDNILKNLKKQIKTK